MTTCVRDESGEERQAREVEIVRREERDAADDHQEAGVCEAREDALEEDVRDRAREERLA